MKISKRQEMKTQIMFSIWLFVHKFTRHGLGRWKLLNLRCYFCFISRQAHGPHFPFWHRQLQRPLTLHLSCHLLTSTLVCLVTLYRRFSTDYSNCEYVCIILQPELPNFRQSGNGSRKYLFIYFSTLVSRW